MSAFLGLHANSQSRTIHILSSTTTSILAGSEQANQSRLWHSQSAPNWPPIFSVGHGQSLETVSEPNADSLPPSPRLFRPCLATRSSVDPPSPGPQLVDSSSGYSDPLEPPEFLGTQLEPDSGNHTYNDGLYEADLLYSSANIEFNFTIEELSNDYDVEYSKSVGTIVLRPDSIEYARDEHDENEPRFVRRRWRSRKCNFSVDFPPGAPFSCLDEDGYPYIPDSPSELHDRLCRGIPNFIDGVTTHGFDYLHARLSNLDDPAYSYRRFTRSNRDNEPAIDQDEEKEMANHDHNHDAIDDIDDDMFNDYYDDDDAATDDYAYSQTTEDTFDLDAHRRIIMQNRAQKRMRRMTSSSLGKRTISESLASDAEDDRADLARCLGNDDELTNARRTRRRLDRHSMVFHDPPPPRIDEMEEPPTDDDEGNLCRTVKRKQQVEDGHENEDVDDDDGLEVEGEVDDADCSVPELLAKELPYWTLDVDSS